MVLYTNGEGGRGRKLVDSLPMGGWLAGPTIDLPRIACFIYLFNWLFDFRRCPSSSETGDKWSLGTCSHSFDSVGGTYILGVQRLDVEVS